MRVLSWDEVMNSAPTLTDSECNLFNNSIASVKLMFIGISESLSVYHARLWAWTHGLEARFKDSIHEVEFIPIVKPKGELIKVER